VGRRTASVGDAPRPGVAHRSAKRVRGDFWSPSRGFVLFCALHFANARHRCPARWFGCSLGAHVIRHRSGAAGRAHNSMGGRSPM